MVASATSRQADSALDASPVSLPVVETFHSVQGEGAWVGTSAFFIRLAGCDVGCPWCDTQHSWNPTRHPLRTVDDLVAAAQRAQPKIVVVTGGEPLMHNLDALTRQLKQAGLRSHLETSGSHPFSGSFDWVTFSPKPFKPPHQSIYQRVSELKVVVSKSEDLEWAEVQAARVPEEAVRMLQPEWTTPGSTELIFQYVLEHPKWRVSLQTHKYMNVR
ncbi:MAG: 7-carboxy-7-deazaguanine synthase QueE [Elainellaceae cyanobacterium]